MDFPQTYSIGPDRIDRTSGASTLRDNDLGDIRTSNLPALSRVRQRG